MTVANRPLDAAMAYLTSVFNGLPNMPAQSKLANVSEHMERHDRE